MSTFPFTMNAGLRTSRHEPRSVIALGDRWARTTPTITKTITSGLIPRGFLEREVELQGREVFRVSGSGRNRSLSVGREKARTYARPRQQFTDL